MNLLHASYRHPVAREWQKQYAFKAENMMYPVFVLDQRDAQQEIESMPGQYRYGIDNVVAALEPLINNGLSSIILFPVVTDSSIKRSDPSAAINSNHLCDVIPLIKKAYPKLFIACDVCLCAWTDHGHCGVLDKYGHMDNVKTTQALALMASRLASAGADCIAPSDMSDGRVKSIKDQLIADGFGSSVLLMSYSAKFASAFYGPFRDAAQSSPAEGDRKCYQLPAGAKGLAKRAIHRDVQEGADIVMVKPGYPYLDVVSDAKHMAPNLAIAVYQVSGEYSMLYHAANTLGLVDYQQGVMEAIEAYARAGATVIISYFTPQVLLWLKQSQK
ncbi:hypothetical protein MP228_009537 [Amoeboaphelidium protococcarum]|nr:hypothetical protein MP228_009537 [Amoeboaphelidium protococcarum]